MLYVICKKKCDGVTFPKYHCRLSSIEIRWKLTRFNCCTPLRHANSHAKAFIHWTPSKKVISCMYKSEEIAPTWLFADYYAKNHILFNMFFFYLKFNKNKEVLKMLTGKKSIYFLLNISSLNSCCTKCRQLFLLNT